MGSVGVHGEGLAIVQSRWFLTPWSPSPEMRRKAKGIIANYGKHLAACTIFRAMGINLLMGSDAAVMWGMWVLVETPS